MDEKLKILVGMIQFDKDGLVRVSDADAQLHDNPAQLEAIDYGFDTISDLFAFDEKLTFDINPESQGELSIADIDGEKMLKFKIIFTFKPTGELSRQIIEAITFNENGYANLDEANKELRSATLDTDIFNRVNIESLISSGIIFGYSAENKDRVKVLLEETGGKTVLKKEISEPTPPEGFSSDITKREMIAFLKSAPKNRMTLSEIANRLKSKNISFSKSYPIKYFISKHSDSFIWQVIDNSDYCVLRTQKNTTKVTNPPVPTISPVIPLSPVTPNTTVNNPENSYSLGQIIAIGDRKIFYSKLVELAKEDNNWIYLEDSSNPYRFLSARVDFMLAYALKNKDTTILKADFFEGTLDSGLTSKNDKKILLRFMRNNYPDKDHPHPWTFTGFELV